MHRINTTGCSINYRNWLARQNGNKGEQIAQERIDDLELVNGLIDAQLKDRPVEIKTCQEWHSNGRGRCRGRFVLRKDQHEYLTKFNGLYVMIVLMGNGRIRMRIINAKDLFPNGRFRRKISWKEIFDRE